MSKPWIHAQSSARRFGGVPEDYIEIHNLMDSSKATIADSRHRALTHTAWFVGTILERVFGVVITNADGRQVSVRDVGEQHVLEDFGGRFIPSAQDYLAGIPMQEWMVRGKGAAPGSIATVEREKASTTPHESFNWRID
jgi:hypothetical protein